MHPAGYHEARRVPRILLIACPLLLGACGMIAGLDGYTEGDDLTTDGGKDGAPGFAADGSGMSDDGSGINLEGAAVHEVEGGVEDSSTPPPPPLDAATLTDGCPASGQLYASCGKTSTCCTNECNEQRRCVTTCAAMDAPCKDNGCCVTTFCPYYNGGSAACTKCLPKDTETPIVTSFNGLDVMKRACCTNDVHTDYSKGFPGTVKCN